MIDNQCYIQQRDRFRCGPIAIVNTLKWQGWPVTYQDMLAISDKYNCKKGAGLWGYEIEPLIQQYIQPAKRTVGTTVRNIDQWLDKGNAVILRYVWGDVSNGEAHYGLFYKKTKHYYEGANVLRNRKTGRIPRNTMIQWIKRINYKGATYPWIWYIER